MNYKMIFKNVALSTLLLSAVAGPTVFADSSHPSTKLEHAAPLSSANLIEPVKLETINATAAFQILDPIKLAEAYAKDTVKEWQAVIAQYDSLISKRFETISIGEFTEAGVALPSLSSEKMSLTAVAQPMLQSITVSTKDLASVKANSVEAIPAPLTSIPLQAGSTVSVAGITSTDSAIAIKVSPFFEGMMALGKAVESKDENSIRGALAKQLELYKEEITALSQDLEKGNK
ncbi:hypothetical protein AB4Z29_09410 [Paenibacillus sp. 2TAB23]|uniref:hypothetical protein n=1 Tax=Paenibacillus sp. 2TAB23 TaxID=3233004 RepID=UPI003F9B4EC1